MTKPSRYAPDTRRAHGQALLCIVVALVVAYHLTDLLIVLIEGEVTLAMRSGQRTLTGAGAFLYAGAIMSGLAAFRAIVMRPAPGGARSVHLIALSAALMLGALIV